MKSKKTKITAAISISVLTCLFLVVVTFGADGTSSGRTFFGWVWKILQEYYPLLLQGTLYTIIIAIIGTVVGFVIGLLVAIVRTTPKSKNPVARVLMYIVNLILRFYVFLFRGTPMMVQAMVIFYGVAMAFGVNMAPLFAGCFIVAINTGAYMAEIIRGGVISVDPGQNEGAYAIGMTHWQTMTSVIMPQAIRNSLPSITNQLIVNLKDSSVLSCISVTELFYIGKRAAGTYARYFEAFAIVSVIYLILTGVSNFVISKVEKKLNGPQNYSMQNFDKGSC